MMYMDMRFACIVVVLTNHNGWRTRWWWFLIGGLVNLSSSTKLNVHAVYTHWYPYMIWISLAATLNTRQFISHTQTLCVPNVQHIVSYSKNCYVSCMEFMCLIEMLGLLIVYIISRVNRIICLRISRLQVLFSALYPFGPLPSVSNPL